MTSKFGGIPVVEHAQSKFGGIPVTQTITPVPMMDEPENDFGEKATTFGNEMSGAGEVVATMATSAAGEVTGGLAGLISMLLPNSVDAGVSVPSMDQLSGEKKNPNPGEVVEAVSEAMTRMPRTEEGLKSLAALSEKLKPFTELLEKAEKGAGDIGFDIAGPIGGAVGSAVPEAVSSVLGLKGTKAMKKLSAATPDADAQAVLQAAKEFDVPILTTDVRPPDTFTGKFLQQFSEKLGPLGSGTARQSQQAARESMVEGLADEFNVELDSTFAEQMIDSINEKTAKTLEEAGIQRKRAVTALDKYGEVPLDNTRKAIANQIERQSRLGDRADTALVKQLEDTLSAIDGGDFSLVKDIRTEVISDLKALVRSDDRRAEASVQAVKSAIDEDIKTFAYKNDSDAAKDWMQSNRVFAEELSRTRDTELRNILRRGDATPEVVMPVLKNGKLSELRRLKESLGVDGRASARAAIIQDALKDSGFFSGNINPDRLATALSRPNRQQAINVFFEGKDKAQLRALTRLLDATRRAQQAAAAPATGIQTVPLLATGAFGTGMSVSPMTTMLTSGTIAAFAKAYESGPMRSLLLKLDSTQKGSKAETGILEAAVPGVLAALQAAKTEQEEKE